MESFALIQHRLGTEAVRVFQDDIVPLIGIEWIDEAVHMAGVSAILVAGKRNLSLVDCTSFIRLRLNTLQLAAGMKGVATRRSPQGRRRVISYGEFRFDTPQLAAGSFI